MLETQRIESVQITRIFVVMAVANGSRTNVSIQRNQFAHCPHSYVAFIHIMLAVFVAADNIYSNGAMFNMIKSQLSPIIPHHVLAHTHMIAIGASLHIILMLFAAKIVEYIQWALKFN